MMVKDVNGSEFHAATNGKANAGLTLGIIGTALGGLIASKNSNGNGGLLSGLFGDNTTQEVAVPVPMPVTEHQYYEDSMRKQREYYVDSMCRQRDYYEDSIRNQKDFFAYAQSVSDRICNLEQRVAVDETAISKNFDYMASHNDWQDKFFNEKFRYADLLEQCRISDATCKCIKGEVYASPKDIADPYVGSQLILGSRQVFPTYSTYSDCGCNNGWGYSYNGYNSCGCGNW